ncbi:MAG: response regulator transcription factor [Clostridia bacterium]|nr:response regulator transcription factor [Clostridia bacterium]
MQERKRIFIVEDDPTLCKLLSEGLTRWGYLPFCAEDFSRVDEEYTRCNPQLVLLDISLPCYSGYHWCAQIRRRSAVPIVFLSSHNEDMDIIMAMQMGGDDYLVKPFSLDVLIAKLQAVLRRGAGNATPELEFWGARLSPGEGCLYIKEGKIELTKNELRILQTLLERKGRLVTRTELMLRLWDSDSFIDENTLTVNINRLRKKLDAAGLSGCIGTRRGEGYLLHEK